MLRLRHHVAPRLAAATLALSPALVAACGEREARPLAVVQRLIEVPADAPAEVVAEAPSYCELGGESRPSVGCAAAFHVTVAEVEVAPPVLRERVPAPPATVGSRVFVQSKLYFVGDERPQFLPGVVPAEPLGEELPLEVPVLPGIRSGTARLELRLRPIPPPLREIASREVTVEPGAVLDFGVALDPIAEHAGVSPVEMAVVARRAGGETALFRTLLRPGTGDVGRWQDHRIDLAALAGERVSLVLRSRALAAPGGEGAPAMAFPVWGPANLLAPGAEPEPRNVILISLDTLRADHLGVYGSSLPTSPEIDRFASEGTVFEQAFATWPSTLHSHMSLFTGRYASSFGKLAIGRRLSPAVPTLPELLGRAGYQTAAVTEDAMVRARLGFQRGVDYYRENRSAVVHRATGQADKTFADGLRWLERHRGERFFLFLHTYQVHDPYTPPPAFDRFRSYSKDGVERAVGPDTPRTIADRLLYAGEVLYTDGEVRKLLDGIDRLGLADDTVVVLTSDHGEEFGEHGQMGHGKSVFVESAHVPLVVRAPGVVPRGLRVPVQVSLVDVAPTLLELAGVPIPEGVDGMSLLPLVRDPAAPAFRDRYVYSELASEVYEHFAVRDGSTTWTFRRRPEASVSVFDRRSDPREKNALADPVVAARGVAARADFERRAAEALARLGAPGEGLDVGGPDAATAAKLRALGYAD